MSPEGRRLIVDLDVASSVRAEVGPAAWVVLEVLAGRSSLSGPVVEIEAGTRELGASLGLSKDTVARSLRALIGAGVVTRSDGRCGRTGQFTPSMYVLDIAAAGLTIEPGRHEEHRPGPRRIDRDMATSDTAVLSPAARSSESSMTQLSLLA